MAQMKRVPANQLKKANEKMKQKRAVKITGSASTTPRVSNSMISSRPKTTASTKKPAVKITTGTTSRRKNVIPPDYDVILPGMGYTRPRIKSQPKKIKKK
jgi:hypothetical protein